METEDVLLAAGEVHDLADDPTNLSSGDEFTIQNLTPAREDLTTPSNDWSIEARVGESEPDLENDAFFVIPRGAAWNGEMPTTGSIYIGSATGGLAIVGKIG